MTTPRNHHNPSIKPKTPPRAHGSDPSVPIQWHALCRSPPIMVRDHTNPDPHQRPQGGRLNLLLSRAGWEPDPWAERLPRMLEPMGVRSHIAQSAEGAQRVIASHPIHIAVIDLALPLHDQSSTEESGPRLLELLSRLTPAPPTVVIKRRRTARDEMRELSAALRMGAFAVVDRPEGTSDLESLLEVLRRILTRHYQDRWPGG